jgi:hypothetical protein
MSITTAFLALAAIVALADIRGPGHDWGPLAWAVAWLFVCRALNPRGWKWLLYGALWLSVAIAALAVVQMWFMDRARGPFASPNYLGAYAVLEVFLAWHFFKKAWPAFLVCGSNILALSLSQSRGALLALGAGLLVLIGRKRPLFAVACCCVPLGTVFLIRPGNEEARLGIWRVGLEVAAQRPLLGWGQGGIGMAGFAGFYNIPLDLLIEAGGLGVLAGAWLVIAAWRAGPEMRPFLAAWFVQGLFLFSIPATSIPLIAVMARLSVRRSRGCGDVPDGAGLVDNHHDLRAGRGRLERLRAEKLQLAVLGAREAQPVEDVLVDEADDRGRIDRPADRCRGPHRHHRADDGPDSQTL